MARKKRRPQPAPRAVESRAIEAATVAWMLSVITTLVCSSVAGVAWLLGRGGEDGGNGLLFSRYLHFSSVVTAVLSLVLTAVVLKGRREAPPPSVTAFAVIVAVLPILAAFF